MEDFSILPLLPRAACGGSALRRMQGQPSFARLALHPSSFRGGEALQAFEYKQAKERKTVHQNALFLLGEGLTTFPLTWYY